MKHILLFVSVAFFSLSTFAQTCSPDAQYANEGPGLYPAGSLGPSCDLTAAKTIIGLTDTSVYNATLGSNVTLYFTQMRVNAVTGLPANLELGTDVMSSADGDAPWGYWDNIGSVPNQSSGIGCAFVSGTGGDWDAAVGGGPNNDGVYPLVFEVDAYIASTDPPWVAGFIGVPTWISTLDPDIGGGPIFMDEILTVPSDYANISTSIAGDSNVEPGTQYTYSVSEDSNVTYTWTATNGNIISGQGTHEVVIEWNGNGNVDVLLVDGGCQGVDGMDVTALPTGLDAVAGINASIYPNPGNGIFNLQLDKTDALNVRILDVSGKVLRSQQLSGNTVYTLNMQTAPIGVYIIELESAEGRTFKRLIKN